MSLVQNDIKYVIRSIKVSTPIKRKKTLKKYRVSHNKPIHLKWHTSQKADFYPIVVHTKRISIIAILFQKDVKIHWIWQAFTLSALNCDVSANSIEENHSRKPEAFLDYYFYVNLFLNVEGKKWKQYQYQNDIGDCW